MTRINPPGLDMFKDLKWSKILIVVFITILIWVWADLALDEQLPDRLAVISVAETADPKLLVSFENGKTVDVRVTLAGPHTEIVTENKKIKEGTSLEFIFNVVTEKIDKPGVYDVPLLAFLQKDKELKKRGLRIMDCQPQSAKIKVVRLVEKTLPVVCVDENKNQIKNAKIEPAEILMMVPDTNVSEMTEAKVKLSRVEREQAMTAVISKKPFIEYEPGQFRYADDEVKIQLPSKQERLSSYTITQAALGVTLSANLQGKYEVVIENLPDLIRAIIIRATEEAKAAYEQMPYQVIFEVYDSDLDSKESNIRRPLIYNFPSDFEKSGDIELNQEPVEVRFTLKPVVGPATPPSKELQNP